MHILHLLSQVYEYKEQIKVRQREMSSYNVEKLIM